jgi:hypothetical protein
MDVNLSLSSLHRVQQRFGGEYPRIDLLPPNKNRLTAAPDRDFKA